MGNFGLWSRCFNRYFYRCFYRCLEKSVLWVCLGLVFLHGCTLNSSQQPASASPKTENAAVNTDTAPVAIPDHFSATHHGSSPQSTVTLKPDAQWWQAFSDPELSQLVSQALNDNLDLKSAYERLRQASARVGIQSADYYPTLDAFLSGEKTDSDEDNSEVISLGLSATYELDLWGRIGSLVEAEESRFRATALDWQTAGLSLSAEVTRVWYQLTEAENQLDLVAQQLAANRQVLSLLQSRIGLGTVSTADALRQEQLLEATLEQQTIARERANRLRYQLAVLLGLPPQTADIPPRNQLPAMPPLPATGVPADLVQRRPDIQASFFRLQASDAELAAAVSDRYPRLSLSASVTTRDEDTQALFDDWITALAANLVAPLIDGGQRRARVNEAQAQQKEQLYQYGQTVLNAFREVETTLMQEQQQALRIQSIERQLQLAEQTYQQLRIEYFNGAGNYIDVLTALTDVQQLKRERLAARLNLLEFRIALYRALAGNIPMTQAQEG